MTTYGNRNFVGVGKQLSSPTIRNNLASLVEKSFDEALFLDNDQGHVKNVKTCGERITSEKVPGSEDLPSMSIRFGEEERYKKPDDMYPYAKLVYSLSDKGKATAIAITKYILSLSDDESKQVEHLDVGSGIQDDALIRGWVEERHGKKLAILLDYDRTLTTIEGGLFFAPTFQGLRDYLKKYNYPAPYDVQNYADFITPEGFTEYYVGGPVRLAMLQQMFDFLYENNVAVFLLTNNEACPQSRGMFEEILNVLTRNRPFQILCGADYDFNKKLTIQRQLNLTPAAPLKALCPVVKAGGKRTRKAHKKQKHKKTRKH